MLFGAAAIEGELPDPVVLREFVQILNAPVTGTLTLDALQARYSGGKRGSGAALLNGEVDLEGTLNRPLLARKPQLLVEYGSRCPAIDAKELPERQRLSTDSPKQSRLESLRSKGRIPRGKPGARHPKRLDGRLSF